MSRTILAVAVLSFAYLCFGQSKLSEPTPGRGSLTEQNPSIIPNAYELGKRAGITEEDHAKLAKMDEKVDDIRGTISWMRGAWWTLGGILALIAIVVKFFGYSLFVAVEHRIEKARANAAASAKKTEA
jgi:hypothetical protein